MSMSTRPSRGEITEGLGALFVIALGLFGIPLLLASIVGWPLPHHVPTTAQLHSAVGSQIPDTFWPKALAVIAWLAWGYFVFSLLTATIDVIRHHRRGTWRRAAGRTSMAALVSAVIVLASIRGSVAAHSVTSMPTVTAVVDASPTPGILLSASHPTAPIYTVVPGDSLWDIAESHYGNGEQWHAISDANVGVVQPDGRALDATNWIYPGWKLAIPNAPTPATAPIVELADTSVPATPAAITYTVVTGDSLWGIAATYYGNGEQWPAIYAANVGVAQPGDMALSDPSLIYPGWTLTIPEAASPQTTSSPLAVAPAQAPARSVPAPPPASIRQSTIPTHAVRSAGDPAGITPAAGRDHHVPRTPSPGPSDPLLPEAVIAGLGLVAAAVLARSLRHRRRRARVSLRPGEMIAASSAQVRDLEAVLAGLVVNAPVDWVDLAMRHLSELDHADPGSVPPVQLVRAGAAGVDLILAEAAAVAPGRFEATEDGWAWHLGPSGELAALGATISSPAWLSALMPIGEDEDGQTYLAPLEPGSILPVTGPGATEMLAAMATVAAGWSWSHQVTVTSDPALAAKTCQAASSVPGRERDRVIFAGSPAALSPEVAARVGILTTDAVAPTGLSLLCSEDGTVEIVPTQLRLRACRLEPDAEASIAEAITTAETQPSTEVPAHRMTVAGIVERDGTPETPAPATTPVAPGGLVGSHLEVRLLTDRPRIDGLSGPGVFCASSRHFELVALLATRRSLTKDQIRTAMYGGGSSIDHVSNIVSQTRQMLGADDSGEPYLPAASPKGTLAVSPRVTCDLIRLCDTAKAASDLVDDPAASIGLYVSALEMIDAGVGSVVEHTWNWWGPFAAVAEAAATEFACRLTRLIIDTRGDVGAARAGLGRARAVDPWAESLYRTAIELAGVCGDLGQAQAEWEALTRMLKDLDPDATPSPETESLYRGVMRRVVATVG